MTLNRFCGSGQQAVNFAALGVMAGQQDLVIGGGVESMSRVPMGADGGGLDGHNPELVELHPLVPQGISADLIATLEGFARDDVDRFAAESQRALRGRAEGRPLRESRWSRCATATARSCSTATSTRARAPRSTALGEARAVVRGARRVRPEGRARARSTSARCSRYPQLEKIEHVHHAGNSSGIVDGAGAVLVASPDYAKAHGLRPRARILAMATAGDEPIIMLTAPAPATERCLAKAA